MITFNDFIKKYNLRNKATSNIKINEVIKNIGLDTKVEIYLRDGSFSTDIGNVNLHPSKRTHWVCYINENFFDSYGCSPPKKLSKYIIKRNGYCLFSEYKIQGLTIKHDSYCGSYCLYVIFLTNVLGIDFKSAVLNSCYQMI